MLMKIIATLILLAFVNIGLGIATIRNDRAQKILEISFTVIIMATVSTMLYAIWSIN